MLRNLRRVGGHRRGAVHPLPAALSFGQGAAVGIPCLTAWRALFQKARLKPGETVPIHGASGGVGIHATQLAHDAGAMVIGTAGSSTGANLVRAAGAQHVVDHSKPGYLDELAQITDGHGVSVIIEMQADINLEQDLHTLAIYGRVVIVGSRGSLDFTPRLTMLKEAIIQGTALWYATTQEAAEALTAVAAGLNTESSDRSSETRCPCMKRPQRTAGSSNAEHRQAHPDHRLTGREAGGSRGRSAPGRPAGPRAPARARPEKVGGSHGQSCGQRPRRWFDCGQRPTHHSRTCGFRHHPRARRRRVRL